jgi:AraC-like DNA-binding protein
MKLLDELARHLANSEDQDTRQGQLFLSRAVARARQFVAVHFSESIVPDDVVGHVHMSRSHFYRRFKAETGMTLAAYITRTRLTKAEMLLANPHLHITEIALQAGFMSISRFNDLFKKQFGMSPTDYRKVCVEKFRQQPLLSPVVSESESVIGIQRPA